MTDTHETIEDVVRKIRNKIAELRRVSPNVRSIAADWWEARADEIEAAHRRERGNAAKLREALDESRRIASDLGGCRLNDYWKLNEIVRVCEAALSAPPRNCDVYTSDELKVKFKSELASELPIANEHEKNLVAITAMGVIDTLFATATEKEGGGR